MLEPGAKPRGRSERAYASKREARSRRQALVSTVLALAFGWCASLFLGELIVRAVLSLRTSPFEACAEVNGPFMQYHPTRGFALVPNANTHMSATEYDVPVRINGA